MLNTACNYDPTATVPCNQAGTGPGENQCCNINTSSDYQACPESGGPQDYTCETAPCEGCDECGYCGGMNFTDGDGLYGDGT